MSLYPSETIRSAAIIIICSLYEVNIYPIQGYGCNGMTIRWGKAISIQKLPNTINGQRITLAIKFVVIPWDPTRNRSKSSVIFQRFSTLYRRNEYQNDEYIAPHFERI